MAQAALAYTTPPPANDNGDRKVDKWWLIITTFRARWPALGVVAAQRKLRGQPVEEFIAECLAAVEYCDRKRNGVTA